MKKVLLLLLLSAPFAVAMDKDTITMPDKKVLQERLDSIGMTHFAEKTNIISQLAGQKKAPLGVAMAIETSMYDYLEDLKGGGLPAPMLRMQTTLMNMNKPLLFEALLKDEPAALASLKSQGVYTPAK